ncbi:MAG: PAS domain-containing protein, partial [bacterium]|nr:PAS domain-containing protein [bacterium]
MSEANSDLRNLLDSPQIATIFVDNDLCIKRFTSEATKVIHLIQTDVGRPLGDIVSNLRHEPLIQDAQNVLKILVYQEKEVQTKDGAWYIMRIAPYRTTGNVISGVVITFVDITGLKRAEQVAREAQDVMDMMRKSLVLLDKDLRVVSA